ncbi:hypothetical protein FDJ25_gp167 [Vibrio phage Aphrodite1]|uniref:Uncharacterized protein n=1 Tax=Vibrio phage Aphrodite1 TaxID=2070057 RepID=A0A2I7QHU6_9CAUD|nr:hypothetical protein FDJ25_gp167 [Vibrio phage Aphrodite1]AUR80973.1 hypothetical protein Aphrodite1_0034 [Vibrio phage Aphrodite1]
MNHFIKALEHVVHTSEHTLGEVVKYGWSYQFDLIQEGMLPQWSGIVELPAIKPALAELDWLINNQGDLTILHDAGLHHHDYLEFEQDLTFTKQYKFEERCTLATERFLEAGLIVQGEEGLKGAFLDNGMMDRHLTVDKCMAAMGITEAREETVGKEGGIGPCHGLAFKQPTNTGTILFHHPDYLPDPETPIQEGLSEGRYSYIPKQIMMTFLTSEVPLEERALQLKDPKASALLAALLKEEPFERLVELGFKYPKETHDNVERIELIQDLFNGHGIPSKRLHTRLTLGDFSPLKEYMTELLPYMIYSEYVAHKINAENTTFTVDANQLILDKETLAMLNTIVESDQDWTKPATVKLLRPYDMSLTQPITEQELEIKNYSGL